MENDKYQYHDNSTVLQRSSILFPVHYRILNNSQKHIDRKRLNITNFVFVNRDRIVLKDKQVGRFS